MKGYIKRKNKKLEDYEKCINVVEIHMLEYNPASFKKYLID